MDDYDGELWTLLKTQDQVSFVPVEAKEVDPAVVKGSCQPIRRHLEPAVVPVLASQLVVADLAAPILTASSLRLGLRGI